MDTNPNNKTPVLTIAGIVFTLVAMVALVTLLRFRSMADTVQQSANVGNVPPTVDTLAVSETSGGGQIANFTPNEGATKTIYIHGTVSDPNGCENITGVTVTVSRSDKGAEACTSDQNDCYKATLAGGDFTNVCSAGVTNKDFEKSFAIANFADPTDTGTHASLTWVGSVAVTDGAYTTTSTVPFEMNSLAAFSVDPSTIDYGTLELGSLSASDETLTFYNTGNINVDSDVLATSTHSGAMVSSLYPAYVDIPASNTHYSLSSAFGYWSGIAVSGNNVSTDLALALAQQTDDLTQPSKLTYWKLKMPENNVNGSYTNTLVFTAKAQNADFPLVMTQPFEGPVNALAGSAANAYFQIADYLKVTNMSFAWVSGVSSTISADKMTNNGPILFAWNDESSNNLQTFDATVPASTHIADTITVAGGVKDLYIDNTNHLLFAVTGGSSNNFVVYDITDPDNLVELGSTTIAHNLVNIRGGGTGVAYVYATDAPGDPAPRHGYVTRVDTSTPSAPVGGMTATTYPDGRMSNLFAGDVYHIFVAGNNGTYRNTVQFITDNYNTTGNWSTMGNLVLNNNNVIDINAQNSIVYVMDDGSTVGSKNLNAVYRTAATVHKLASTRVGTDNGTPTYYDIISSNTMVYAFGGDTNMYVMTAPTLP